MENTWNFNGKVALITGAASGMGLATALAFAESGASVVMADVRLDLLKAEADKLVAADHKIMALQCDVSDDAQVEQMVERTVSEFGRLDAAFNNAGVMARIVSTADSTRANAAGVRTPTERTINPACAVNNLPGRAKLATSNPPVAKSGASRVIWLRGSMQMPKDSDLEIVMLAPDASPGELSDDKSIR